MGCDRMPSEQGYSEDESDGGEGGGRARSASRWRRQCGRSGRVALARAVEGAGESGDAVLERIKRKFDLPTDILASFIQLLHGQL